MFAEILEHRISRLNYLQYGKLPSREFRIFNLDTPFFGMATAEGKHIAVMGQKIPKVYLNPETGEELLGEDKLNFFAEQILQNMRKMEAKLVLDERELRQPFFYLGVYENDEDIRVFQLLAEKKGYSSQILQSFRDL